MSVQLRARIRAITRNCRCSCDNCRIYANNKFWLGTTAGLLLPSISGDIHSLERFLFNNFWIARAEILCGFVAVGLGIWGLGGAGTKVDAMMAHNSSKLGEFWGIVEPFSSFASSSIIFAWVDLRVVWPLCLVLEILYFFWNWLMNSFPSFDFCHSYNLCFFSGESSAYSSRLCHRRSTQVLLEDLPLGVSSEIFSPCLLLVLWKFSFLCFSYEHTRS